MGKEASRIISSEGKVYGGVDESNHGQFPEFFALVLSGNPKDIINSTTMGKAKTETNLRNILKKVSRRGHTFLQVEKRDYDRVAPYKFLGQVTASLTEDFLPSDLDMFYLFIDGKLTSSQKLYSRDLLSDIHGLSKKQIYLRAGGKYDKRFPIVNLADGISRYYFRAKLSVQQISKNPCRRELLHFEK